MLRKLALSLAVAGALSATQANALGLGTIQVNSALNEPLNAEIKLLQVRDLSPLQIQPRMADIDEFSLAGISKSRFLSDVKFDVKVLPDGTGVIKLNSSTPIKEPFLNFLVEVNWPSGRLVREYTLLLDPPLFDPTPAPGSQAVTPAQSTAPVSTGTSQAKRSQSTSAPVAGSATQSQAAGTSNIQSRVNPNTEVYVDVRDTLWELALEHRPNRSVTPEQMMLALQRKNPQSFPGGNINFLKAGTVLRLPSLEEIKALTAAEARAEARRQTQAWRDRRSSTSNTVAEPAEKPDPSTQAPADTAAASTEQSEPDSQLKVVTPDDAGESAQATTASAATASQASEGDSQAVETDAENAAQEGAETPAASALAERNEELENRLLLTQESVAKVELENAELNDKIDSIASQIDKMQKLIELKDRELAMMQQQMDQRDAEDDEMAGIVEQMLNNPMYLAGAGGAALLAFLLGLMLARRGKGGKEEKAEAAESGTARTSSDSSPESDAIPDMAMAAAAGAAGAAVAAQGSQDEKEEVSEEPVAEAAAETEQEDLAEDDLSDLDLDMDLDLDETASTDDSTSVNDDEFDLGIDDLEEESSTDDGDEIDSSLDDLLSADNDDDELPGPLDEFDSDDSLADFDALAEPEAETETEAEAESPASELDELDFAVDGFDEDKGESATETEEQDDLLDLPDDLEFDVNKVAEEAAEEESAESIDDELAGLDFSVDDEAKNSERAASGDDDDLLEDFFDEELPENEGDFAALSELSDEDVEPLTDDSLDIDTPDETLSLQTVEPIDEPDDSAVDDGLDEMLLNSYGDEDEEDGDSGESVDEDDLDALLSSFEPEEEEDVQREPKPGERVEEELTANIAHDLEADLDSELDALLDSTDDEIALEEEDATESSDQADDPLDTLNLLDGADENETKLDLARAYIEMEDREGAKDILNEILGEGNHFQRREAQRLLDSLNG